MATNLPPSATQAGHRAAPDSDWLIQSQVLGKESDGLVQSQVPWDFPGGPVVRTLHFHGKGHGFDP